MDFVQLNTYYYFFSLSQINWRGKKRRGYKFRHYISQQQEIKAQIITCAGPTHSSLRPGIKGKKNNIITHSKRDKRDFTRVPRHTDDADLQKHTLRNETHLYTVWGTL